jgi:putative ABC transport system ATP-binding protein
MLVASGVSKSYDNGVVRQRVLDRVDLSVRRGEILALLGSSGSGKTTLLNLLSGIDRPDSGTVEIDGTAVQALPEPGRTLFRRRRVGLVFQFFNLVPTLTVGENIALPLLLNGADPATAAGRVADLLEQVGLPDLAGRFPDTLSGGEQQRVAVARALAHRPALLLADEPTGNLDQATGQRIVELLTRLARDQDATLVVVTHSARVAEAADRVMRLEKGRPVPA